MADTVANLCKTCHAPLSDKQITRGNLFCSPSCSRKGRTNQIQRTCIICGKVFSRQPTKISDYCSGSCSHIGHRKDITASFWEKVDKSSDCWVWTGGKGKSGHGLFTKGHKGRTIGAHRFSYELAYGPIPDDLAICHHCDNPPCVRPEHLFVGTRADNNLDKVLKGRQTNGQAVWQAKLTEDDVRAIRAATIKRGELKAFAQRYGVWPETITRIRQRKLWKHLD